MLLNRQTRKVLSIFFLNYSQVRRYHIFAGNTLTYMYSDPAGFKNAELLANMHCHTNYQHWRSECWREDTIDCVSHVKR
jgi:hypothetical protein